MEHEARPRSTCWSVDEARVADYIAEMRKVFNSLEGSCAKLLEEHEAQLRTQLFQLLALTPWSDVEWVLDSDKGELQAQRIVSFSPVRTEHSIVALDVPCEPSDSNMHDGLPPPLAPTRSESPMTSGRSGINIGATPSKSGFKLLNDWMLLHEGSASSLDSMEDTVQGMSAKYASRLNRLLDRGGGSSENVVAAVTRSRCVFRPATKPKIAWDLIAAALLAYDLVMIPMGIFSIPRKGFITLMGITVALYWTIDIILNFFVGYVKVNGDTELRFHRVARRYFLTWLIPDVLIVSLDWMTYVVPSLIGSSSDRVSPAENLGIVRVAKLARFARVLRILRLMRLGKLRQAFHRIQDSIGFETTAIAFSLGRNVLGIMFINHIIACVWYWVCSMHDDGGWRDAYPDGSAAWYSEYLRALHWSIANFTPGSSGLQPKTTEEMFFAVVVLFFALVIFSVFVSSTTSLIQRLMGLQSSRKQQLWVLKSFLLQHKFDTDLRERVLRYVNTALGGRKDYIHRADVGLLELLSQPLREEVDVNLHLNSLRGHPFFRIVCYGSPLLMRKISVEALAECAFSRGDTIFNTGEAVDKMGFVVSGVLSYDSVTSHAELEGSSVLLGGQDFFCEAVLWTKWRARGTLHADGDCAVLELSGAAFRACFHRYPLLTSFVQSYAKAFVDVLNMAATHQFKHPLTDLQASYVADAESIHQVLQGPLQHR
mmetsp:Transcript_44990/g.104115  ORF Transcript_44990/g.104115 Transcript_44990/m.104115 type:complete len:711 (+) Transcript_44990:39-2171(+)